MSFIIGEILSNPLISVVVPITRYELELPEALHSILQQTYQNLEVILVDNHATAGSRTVAKQWQEKSPNSIRIVTEETRGACSARNRGILESRGEFVALLDSDDRMKPDRLEKQLNMFLCDNSTSLVGSWFDSISPDGLSVVDKDNKPSIPRWGKMLFRGEPRWDSDPFYEPLTSTFFFKKSDAQKIGMFDEKFNPIWQEDTDFSFRLYEVGAVRIVSESLVDYRIHNASDGIRRIFDPGVIVNHDVLFSKLRDRYFKRESKDSRARFESLRSRWLRESGVKLMYYKEGLEIGKVMVKRAFRGDPFDIKNIETVIRTALPQKFHPKAFGVSVNLEVKLPGFVTHEWAQRLFSLD